MILFENEGSREKERYTDTNSFWLYNQASSGTHERTTEKEDQGRKMNKNKEL